MNLYRKAYLLLFNAITDALKEKDLAAIKFLLMRSQQEAEELFINDAKDGLKNGAYRYRYAP